MAYGVIYRMRFKDNEGIQWIADILKEDYVGSVSAVKGWSSAPVMLELDGDDDPFAPILHTNVTVKLVSETIDEFIEFHTANVFQYYLDLQRAGSTYWKGPFVTETLEEDYTSAPYSIELTFNDGLSELQFERYDNAGTLRSTHETVINILVNCMNELPTELARGFREMVNVFEDNMNDADTEGLLEQLYIFEAAFWEIDGDGVIKGIDCLTVIEGIMISLKCRIVMSQDTWYIQRIGEMLKTSGIKHVDYNSSGTVTGNGTLDIRQAKSLDTASMDTLLIAKNNDAKNHYNKEYQEVMFSYTSKNITTLNNNILINWNFDRGFDVENGSPVPKHFTRSSAVNTSIGVTPTGLHVDSIFIPTEVDITDEGTDETNARVLVMGNSLLENTKITNNPQVFSDVLQVDATRETYNLTPESPADSSLTVKNFRTDDSDHLEIRISGWFDYEFTGTTVGSPLMFNKWTVKLGSNYYNTSNQAWDTNATNRVWDREWASYWEDEWITPQLRKRHHFSKVIRLADFPSDSIDDLVITWFIPETSRGSNNFNNNEIISSVEITFEHMQIRYISNDSTEFSVQKALGETGDADLRSLRYDATVIHGDGPSDFSVMSFRVPTTFLATAAWSTRGGSEALPGFKILVIDAVFENLGTYRQVWTGTLYGFLELHNTVSSIDSKVFLIKSYSFDVKGLEHGVTLHEVAALSPVIVYFPQINLAGRTFPSIADDSEQQATTTDIDNNATSNQGAAIINTKNMGIAFTAPIISVNDDTETGGDYPT